MKESELCAKFKAAAEADGWAVYPETDGWDLVLVWTGEAPIPLGATEVQKGDQVAVEAKLRANVEALRQAVTRSSRTRRGSPDFRAVLAPKASTDFVEVAAHLDIGVYTLRHCGPWAYKRYTTQSKDRKIVAAPPWRHDVKNRLWLPPVIPQGPGGEPNPRPLSAWRVQALLLMARLRERGYVTTEDFREFGISSQIWIQQKWIVHDGYVGRRYRYSLNKIHTKLPDRGFEAERVELSTRVDN